MPTSLTWQCSVLPVSQRAPLRWSFHSDLKRCEAAKRHTIQVEAVGLATPVFWCSRILKHWHRIVRSRPGADVRACAPARVSTAQRAQTYSRTDEGLSASSVVSSQAIPWLHGCPRTCGG